jgi:cold shock protein
MLNGTVKWFNDGKGFGFISSEGKDYFVHYKEIQSDGFKSLKEGDRVRFESGHSPKGAVAKNVHLDHC